LLPISRNRQAIVGEPVPYLQRGPWHRRFPVATRWAHQEALALSEETPVVHRTVQQAQALWRQCLLHEVRIQERTGRLGVRVASWLRYVRWVRPRFEAP